MNASIAKRRRQGSVTFADFCTLVQPGQKADLIDGAIFLDPCESPRNNLLFGWLMSLMNGWASETDAGRMFASRVAFKIDNRNAPEPDLGFVRRGRLRCVKQDHVVGPPDLALEIVAPESVERDYDLKFKLYERAGVSEYWIVDPDFQDVLAYRLGTTGKYRRVPLANRRIRSQAMPGFWLAPAWLWSKAEPCAVDALNEILAS